MKRKVTLPIVLVVAAMAVPSLAAADQGGPLDRAEDRLDRIESRIDERRDFGPLDRIEDRIDRRESWRDRRNVKGDVAPCAGEGRACRIKRLDRIEDRIDRRESRIDERYDFGPLDRIEDRIDRRESRRDRLR